jgi:hypothetical protein
MNSNDWFAAFVEFARVRPELPASAAAYLAANLLFGVMDTS